jgi:hypothetical protein
VLRQLTRCGGRRAQPGDLGQGPGEPPVHRLPLTGQEGGVDRLGEQGMPEPERAGGLVGHEHAVLDRLLQRRQQPRLGQVDDGGEQPVGHVPSGGRRDPQQQAGLGVEPGDPPQQQVVEGTRELLAAQRRGQQLRHQPRQLTEPAGDLAEHRRAVQRPQRLHQRQVRQAAADQAPRRHLGSHPATIRLVARCAAHRLTPSIAP